MALAAILPDRERSRDPMAAISEGTTRGMMMHLSILRNSLPRKLMYMMVLGAHGLSVLSFRDKPRIMPAINYWQFLYHNQR